MRLPKADSGIELLMALIAHIDSGSDPTSSHFVLSGYVYGYEQWAAFSDDWAAVLASSKPVGYLKASGVWDWKRGES